MLISMIVLGASDIIMNRYGANTRYNFSREAVWYNLRMYAYFNISLLAFFFIHMKCKNSQLYLIWNLMQKL